MTTTKEQPPETIPEEEAWESELERVGFVRRIFLARRWYGADWWFVAISTAMVIAFIVIALVPGWFAPYSPNALVGHRFLAPGEQPAVPVLIVPANFPLTNSKTWQLLPINRGQP